MSRSLKQKACVSQTNEFQIEFHNTMSWHGGKIIWTTRHCDSESDIRILTNIFSSMFGCNYRHSDICIMVGTMDNGQKARWHDRMCDMFICHMTECVTCSYVICHMTECVKCSYVICHMTECVICSYVICQQPN